MSLNSGKPAVKFWSEVVKYMNLQDGTFGAFKVILISFLTPG